MARSPIAFVMSGGGSQGSFEAGVLRFLYDDLGLRPVDPRAAARSGRSSRRSSPRVTTRRPAGAPSTTSRRSGAACAPNDDMWLTEPWLDKLRSQVTGRRSCAAAPARERHRRGQPGARRSCGCSRRARAQPAPDRRHARRAPRQAMRARSLREHGADPRAGRARARARAHRRRRGSRCASAR